jgi:hypothetical protein
LQVERLVAGGQSQLGAVRLLHFVCYTFPRSDCYGM